MSFPGKWARLKHWCLVTNDGHRQYWHMMELVLSAGSGSTLVCIGSDFRPPFLDRPECRELFVRPAKLIAREAGQWYQGGLVPREPSLAWLLSDFPVMMTVLKRLWVIIERRNLRELAMSIYKYSLTRAWRLCVDLVSNQMKLLAWWHLHNTIIIARNREFTVCPWPEQTPASSIHTVYK